MESLEEAERRRRMEAADLERMLEEARELMKRAQRRRWVLFGCPPGLALGLAAGDCVLLLKCCWDGTNDPSYGVPENWQ